jgi:hypothetical protein
MMLYMASDAELPLTEPWKPGMSFSVEALSDEKAKLLRDKLPARHRYYVGSEEGCGCAFRLEIRDNGEVFDEQASPSRSGLQSYLETHLDDGMSAQFYSCWDGDELLPVALRSRLRVHDLSTSAWLFEQREYVSLRRD